MTHASLFSGIGGAEIAAAWLGWQNLFHCDINEFGRKVLRYWFPNSKEYNDIKTTDFTEWRGRLTSSPQGSPASPSVWRESERERTTTATSGLRLSESSRRSGPLGSWVRTCLESRRWYSPARRLTWAAQTIFSRRLTHTERSSSTSSTGSARTSRTRDIPSSRLLFRLVPSERRTGGTGFGLLRGGKMQDMMLKTPTAMDAEIGSPKSGNSGCLAQEITGGYAVILPTPTAMSVRHPGRVSAAKARGERVVSQSAERGGSPDRAGGLAGVPRADAESRCAGLQEEGPECEETGTSGILPRPAPYADSGRPEETDERPTEYDEEGLRGDVPGESRIPRFQGWEGFPTQPPVCRGDDGLPFGVADLALPFGRWRREAVKALGNAWVPEVAYEIFRMIQEVEDNGR